MIFLIASGRDGGDNGEPVFFTVPWSPSIEARGQMPGRVYARLRMLREILIATEVLPTFCAMTEDQVFAEALCTQGFGICSALGVTLARRIMLELGMLP